MHFCQNTAKMENWHISKQIFSVDMAHEQAYCLKICKYPLPQRPISQKYCISLVLFIKTHLLPSDFPNIVFYNQKGECFDFSKYSPYFNYLFFINHGIIFLFDILVHKLN